MQATSYRRIVLKGAQVFLEQEFRSCDIAIERRLIADIAPVLPHRDGDLVFSCEGCHIVPGFADVHVHLREPGFSYKETIASGTKAAARGGYCMVCTMPNLDPPPDSLEHLCIQQALIERDAVVSVFPYGCITKNRQGEALSDMQALSPYVVGFSDDGSGVQDDDLMRSAMRLAKQLDMPIVAHCEDETLLQGGYIHDGEYARLHGHKGISAKSEWAQVERDLELVRQVGCRYHVCHVSTAKSVELIRRAKAEGLPVSCETAPHYLLLSDADLQEDGRFKMNPPLRSPADREALIQGLLDGTVDIIATDHAPHSAKEKAGGLQRSAMGVVGLETAFPLLYRHMVLGGMLSLEQLIDRMSLRPRQLFDLPGGCIVRGQIADIALIDTRCAFPIDPSSFLSKGKATPFDGWTAQGRVLLTICQGKIAYKAEDFTHA